MSATAPQAQGLGHSIRLIWPSASADELAARPAFQAEAQLSSSQGKCTTVPDGCSASRHAKERSSRATNHRITRNKTTHTGRDHTHYAAMPYQSTSQQSHAPSSRDPTAQQPRPGKQRGHSTATHVRKEFVRSTYENGNNKTNKEPHRRTPARELHCRCFDVPPMPGSAAKSKALTTPQSKSPKTKNQ